MGTYFSSLTSYLPTTSSPPPRVAHLVFNIPGPFTVPAVVDCLQEHGYNQWVAPFTAACPEDELAYDSVCFAAGSTILVQICSETSRLFDTSPLMIPVESPLQQSDSYATEMYPLEDYSRLWGQPDRFVSPLLNPVVETYPLEEYSRLWGQTTVDFPLSVDCR